MKKNKLILISLISLFIFFAFFIQIQAQEEGVEEGYEVEQALPELPVAPADVGPIEDQVDLITYIRYLYYLLLSLVGLSALLALIIGGIMYMGGGLITQTEEAKKWMTGAILGLVLGFGSWLLLYTINPAFVLMNVPGGLGDLNAEGVITIPDDTDRPLVIGTPETMPPFAACGGKADAICPPGSTCRLNDDFTSTCQNQNNREIIYNNNPINCNPCSSEDVGDSFCNYEFTPNICTPISYFGAAGPFNSPALPGQLCARWYWDKECLNLNTNGVICSCTSPHLVGSSKEKRCLCAPGNDDSGPTDFWGSVLPTTNDWTENIVIPATPTEATSTVSLTCMGYGGVCSINSPCCGNLKCVDPKKYGFNPEGLEIKTGEGVCMMVE